MPVIKAHKVEVEFDRTRWRLFEGDHGHTVSPLFEFERGDLIVTYNVNFGKRVGLPGDRLSINFVRAVLVGYQKEQERWLMGLHLSKDNSEKPVFRVLLSWPPRDSTIDAQDVRQAARALAVMLACPLKVFGEKKLPTESDDKSRSGVTGPLEPHLRKRIEKEDVRKLAADVRLPLNGEGFILNQGRNGVVLQLTKQVGGGVENPIFKMCEINQKQRIVRLIPPTGLLGAFMQSASHEISFHRIYNVEFRHLKEDVTMSVPAQDGNFSIEQSTVRHVWGIFLTLPDESLLLVQDTFTQAGDLMHSRVSFVGGTKFDTNTIEGMNYFRRHMEEQEEIDQRHKSLEHASYVLASSLNVHLVATEVGDPT